jgi:protein Mpv17
MKGLFSCFALAFFGSLVGAFAPTQKAVHAKCASVHTSFSSRGHELFMAESSIRDANLIQEADELFHIPIEKQGRQWDIDTIINKAFIFGAATLVIAKIVWIDSEVSRGWTAAETIQHMPFGVWQSYMSVLTDSPVATKAVTSATVYTIGDVIAQSAEGSAIGEIDRMRTLRSMLAGLIGHGPLSHVWYNVSENLFEHLQWISFWSFIPKVAVDQLFWGPFWNNTYILLLGLMKAESLASIWEDVKRTTVPLVISGLKLWPLAHCVTYGLIPVENRLLWVDLVEIIWVIILSTTACTTMGEAAPQGTLREEMEQEDPAFIAQ